MKIKCSRCGKILSGRTEYDTEVAFSQHVCKGMRNLDDLRSDLLQEVAYGNMTEAEAWKRQDEE
ncbi:MAG: hypothetical protein GY847_01805 [Proteobacteria bacterium]|nr:hypothetical protein [Pseudomonadota bacterium]